MKSRFYEKALHLTSKQNITAHIPVKSQNFIVVIKSKNKKIKINEQTPSIVLYMARICNAFGFVI
jgi:hypothetical protein